MTFESTGNSWERAQRTQRKRHSTNRTQPKRTEQNRADPLRCAVLWRRPLIDWPFDRSIVRSVVCTDRGRAALAALWAIAMHLLPGISTHTAEGSRGVGVSPRSGIAMGAGTGNANANQNPATATATATAAVPNTVRTTASNGTSASGSRGRSHSGQWHCESRSNQRRFTPCSDGRRRANGDRCTSPHRHRSRQ